MVRMAVTVKRTRVLLLAACVLLLAAIAAFYFAGMLKQRALRKDLPARLGLNIQQDSTGFTISKSENGHTLFTLHAARALQFRKGGEARLKDVRITIYGPPGSQQQDRIESSEFLYNQSTGEATAAGEVDINLEGVMYDAAQKARGVQPTAADTERGTIHLRTRGLTFNQKTGIAQTPQSLEFRLPQAEGTAVGAEYDSDGGLLTLDSHVTLHTSLHGDVQTLTASHAVLDRSTRTISLNDASLVSAEREARASRATITMLEDGSLQRIAGEQGISLATSDGNHVAAPRGQAQFNADGEVSQVHLDGGVTFAQNNAARAGHARPYATSGRSQQAWLWFADHGSEVERARLAGSAHLEQKSANAGLSRTLDGNDVTLKFANGTVAGAQASGSPVLTERAATPKGDQTRGLRGDTLAAKFDARGQMESLHASGDTQIAESRPDGSKQSSTGDTLDAAFSAATAQNATLKEAVQRGHVEMRRDAMVSGKPESQIATAETATFRAAENVVILTGSPHLADPTTDLSASGMTLNRATNILHATGAVKGSYTAQPRQAASHVLSDSATIDSARHTARFEGSARLWQTENVLEAPVIVVTQNPKQMTATSGAAARVRASFVQQPQRGGKSSAQPAFVTADRLVYDDTSRLARFTGDVLLRDAQGTVQADTMDLYLAQPNAPAKLQAATPGDFTGRLDRAVASGEVKIEQPGRRGTGDHLVYTAGDGIFVLTGSALRPPRLEDRQKGMITGESLIFRSRDDKVEVGGGQSGTVTTTRVSR